MVAVMATLSVKDECKEEFEQFINVLAEQVRENEPGNIAYIVTKSRDKPNLYRIFEIYRDQNALEEHRKYAHFVAAGSIFTRTLSERPTIEHLSVIG